jgi:glycine betaine/proline transport system permease protein
MDIPRLGKPSILKVKLNGWTLVAMSVLALVVLGAILIQTVGTDMGFPKLAHKTSTFTANDGTVTVWSRDVFINRPIADGLQAATKWITKAGAFIFNPISEGIETSIRWIKKILLWIPWPVLIGAVTLLAFRLAGLPASAFTVCALLLIGLSGLWPSAMETIALMVTAVAISVALAIPLGIMAARSDIVDALMRPILDTMQTMPSFVYLVPVIFFFGLGNAPAVMATIVTPYLLLFGSLIWESVKSLPRR